MSMMELESLVGRRGVAGEVGEAGGRSQSVATVLHLAGELCGYPAGGTVTVDDDHAPAEKAAGTPGGGGRR